MVFIGGTTCPAFIDFFRAIGANEIHFGLFAGIPLITMFFHFIGAVSTNYLKRRKPCFMVSLIVSRLLFIPMVLIPILFPSLGINVMFAVVLVILFISSCLGNFATPLWLAWMADLIPHRILNSYWGGRQFWMYITWVVSFLVLAFASYFITVPITVLFPWITVIAVIAGVIDISLFFRVQEPPNITTPHIPVLKLLTAPLVHKQYMTFIVFSCIWSAVAMFAATFMQLYSLKVLQVPVWQTTLIWCMNGIGIAITGKFWGKLSDKHGHKPVLVILMFLKPIIVFAFLLVTRESFLAVMPAVFFFDGIFNAGLMIASNGYMLKLAPRQNRSAFIAAITGLSGILGGIAAMAGGVFLKVFSDFALPLFGRCWTNYHLLFALDFFLRLGCIFLAMLIRETKSSATSEVLSEIWNVWPLRFIRFPVNLARNHDNGNE